MQEVGISFGELGRISMTECHFKSLSTEYNRKEWEIKLFKVVVIILMSGLPACNLTLHYLLAELQM